MAVVQVTQAVAPALGALPARQGMQVAEALRGATVPLGQALQALEGSAPEPRNVPLRHLVQVVEAEVASVA